MADSGWVIPADRFEELVRTATAIFIDQGYRRTEMADVAEAMGLAKGTVWYSIRRARADR